MRNNIEAKDIDVVILCGGKGVRLRKIVNDRPKVLAEINGHPFLDILLNYLVSFGFRRFILCVCYMGDLIKKHYQNKDVPFEILFSQEHVPLGTAGAVKNTQHLVKSNPFLVINGDVVCNLNMRAFIDFHINKGALFSMVLSEMDNTSDYGKVVVNNSGRIIGFYEKVKSESKINLLNAGIYLLDESIFSEIPADKKCSIEYEVFPKIINKRFYGFITKEKFIDIGTPQRYRQAQIILRKQLR